MKSETTQKALAFYLIGLGILQLVLYVAMSSSKELEWLFYFDPRFGLFFIESMARGSEVMIPGLLDWISVPIIFLVAIFLLRDLTNKSLAAYFLMELVLGLPSLLIFLFVFGANLSPAHGFSIGELLFPSIVFFITFVVPVTLGIATYVLRRREYKQIAFHL